MIELMIVVSIIGVLSAIAIPKFVNFIRKSGEGSGRGNLGALRSALAIYYGEMEGLYPQNITALTVAVKYMEKIPVAKAPNYHPESASVFLLAAPNDQGGWSYDNDAASESYGVVLVNCTHTDSKGTSWTLF